MSTANDALRVLIIGGSRGIGAALVRQYAATGWDVHTTMRRPPKDGEDSDLPKGVTVHALDLFDKDQIAALGPALEGKPLHVLIVAAGTYDRVGGAFGNGPPVPAEEVFWINAGAPMLVAEAVFDNLKEARPGRMVFISSAEGIRGRGRQLGIYGQSKAALNDAIQLYTDDWAWYGVIGIALHPGWVRTDMGGSRAPLLPEDSAAGIQQVVANLTPDDCGTFLDYRGNPMPW